ncbi:MAG: DUF1634 domain-containing protein, partial [Chloroflexota bacterium]|nr:DUF1634 domain-containing protein [Chloroflexota bacterium]
VQAVSALLAGGTILVVGLVAVGTLLALAVGRRALQGPASPFDAGRMIGALLALRPEGFLWLGLLLTVVLPSARVAIALLGFLREGDRKAAAVAVSILGVLGLSVALAGLLDRAGP